MTKHIAILKTGSTHPKLKTLFGDFESWFQKDIQGTQFTTYDLPNGDALPAADQYSGFIVTGSPAMVTDQESWSENLKPLLKTLANRDIPLLAVCYGHQLLAEALGGKAGWHPQGREIGTVAITKTTQAENDPLLSILPSTFFAQVTHAQSVLTLPEGASHLAFNEYEPNHAYRIGQRVWSLQFHPEFTADIMRGYLFETAEKLLNDGISVADKLTEVKSAHASSNLIQRFVDLIE